MDVAMAAMRRPGGRSTVGNPVSAEWYGCHRQASQQRQMRASAAACRESRGAWDARPWTSGWWLPTLTL